MKARILLFSPVLGIVVVLAALTRTVFAEPDVSGDWKSYATGDVSGWCANTFFRDGTSLRAEIDCDIVGRGTLIGTIDAATGHFVIEGRPGGILLRVNGSFSPNGETMQGTWSAPEFGYSGEFTGERGKLVRPTPAPPPVAPPRRGPMMPPLSPGPSLGYRIDGDVANLSHAGYAFNAPPGNAPVLDGERSAAEPGDGRKGSVASLASVGLIGTIVLGYFLRTRQT